MGLSTAYHLAARGRSVVVIDKAAIGSGTSARAAGLLAMLQSDPARARLSVRSAEKIARFGDESGFAIAHSGGGTLKVARGDHCAAYVRQDIPRGQRVGVSVRLVDANEAAAVAPYLVAGPEHTISYTPNDIYFEPEDLLAAYAGAASASGADLRPRCTLIAVERTPTGATRAITSGGDILASTIVDAAGAWAALISARVGVRLPTVPTRHQLVVTQPIAGIVAGQAAVTIVDDNVYTRPCRGGLLVGGYEPDPLQLRSDELTPDYDLAQLPLDPRPLLDMRRRVCDLLPALSGAEVAELRGGLPTMTPDNTFIIDKVSDQLGMYVVSGCCVSGLSMSMAIGESLACCIDGLPPPVDLTAFHLGRFPAIRDAFDRLYERTAWHYAHHQEAD